jgi:hypothetical protein
MRKTNLLFIAAMGGLVILGAITLVINRLLFGNQPAVEDVLSIVWSVVLCIIAYKMLRYIFPARGASKQEWQRNVYGALLFLVEVFAVLTLVLVAIFASVMLTTPGGSDQFVPAAGSVAFLAVALLFVPRLVRLFTHHPVQVEHRSDV